MQDARLVDEIDRAEHLLQQDHDLRRGKGSVRRVQDVVQVFAVDEVDRHVGGVVVFEHLMHADDVRVNQFGQAPRLVDEVLHEAAQIAGVLARPRAHDAVRPAAERVGKTFLDDHGPVERILRQIGDPEPAAVEESKDRVLPVQQRRPRFQVIGEHVLAFGRDRGQLGISLVRALHRSVPVRGRLRPAPGEMARTSGGHPTSCHETAASRVPVQPPISILSPRVGPGVVVQTETMHRNRDDWGVSVTQTRPTAPNSAQE